MAFFNRIHHKVFPFNIDSHKGFLLIDFVTKAFLQKLPQRQFPYRLPQMHSLSEIFQKGTSYEKITKAYFYEN